jgi:hypothetical protein
LEEVGSLVDLQQHGEAFANFIDQLAEVMPAILTYRFSQDTRASKPPMNKRLPPADAARQCCTVLQDRQVFRVGCDEGSNLMRRQPLNASRSLARRKSPLNSSQVLHS